ncbi:MAG: hypothetical protein QY325_11815 [Flavobacteriales bacterium]|nr:MAG: hypothetical protein QY325_11815 [Flavobacteriales bacterium]
MERTGSVRNKYPSLVQSAGAVYSIEGGRSPARLEEGASMVLRVEAVSSLESDSASAAAAAQAIDDLLLVRLQPASTGRTLVVHEQTCYGYRDVRQPGGSMPFQRARCAPLQWELRLGELQPGEYALVPADQITAPAGPIAVYTFGIGEAGPRPSDRIPSH